MPNERPELRKLLDNARERDVVIVWKPDSLTENINTTTPSGELTFPIFAALAELNFQI